MHGKGSVSRFKKQEPQQPVKKLFIVDKQVDSEFAGHIEYAKEKGYTVIGNGTKDLQDLGSQIAQEANNARVNKTAVNVVLLGHGSVQRNGKGSYGPHYTVASQESYQKTQNIIEKFSGTTCVFNLISCHGGAAIDGLSQDAPLTITHSNRKNKSEAYKSFDRLQQADARTQGRKGRLPTPKELIDDAFEDHFTDLLTTTLNYQGNKGKLTFPKLEKYQGNSPAELKKFITEALNNQKKQLYTLVGASERDAKLLQGVDITDNYINLALIHKAKRGDIDGVRKLLASGANPLAVDKYGLSALSFAAHPKYYEANETEREKQTQIVDILLESIEKEQGTVPNLLADSNSDMLKVVFDRIQNNDALKNKTKLKEKLLSGRDSRSHNPLDQAVVTGQDDAIKILLANGANIEAKDASGHTALHKAAFLGKNEAVNILLDKGANIEATDRLQYTPLLKAAYTGENQVVQTLLNRGADALATSPARQDALAIGKGKINTNTSTLIRQRQQAKLKAVIQPSTSRVAGGLFDKNLQKALEEEKAARQSAEQERDAALAGKESSNQQINQLKAHIQQIEARTTSQLDEAKASAERSNTQLREQLKEVEAKNTKAVEEAKNEATREKAKATAATEERDQANSARQRAEEKARTEEQSRKATQVQLDKAQGKLATATSEANTAKEAKASAESHNALLQGQINTLQEQKEKAEEQSKNLASQANQLNAEKESETATNKALQKSNVMQRWAGLAKSLMINNLKDELKKERQTSALLEQKTNQQSASDQKDPRVEALQEQLIAAQEREKEAATKRDEALAGQSRLQQENTSLKDQNKQELASKQAAEEKAKSEEKAKKATESQLENTAKQLQTAKSEAKKAQNQAKTSDASAKAANQARSNAESLNATLQKKLSRAETEKTQALAEISAQDQAFENINNMSKQREALSTLRNHTKDRALHESQKFARDAYSTLQQMAQELTNSQKQAQHLASELEVQKSSRLQAQSEAQKAIAQLSIAQATTKEANVATTTAQQQREAAISEKTQAIKDKELAQEQLTNERAIRQELEEHIKQEKQTLSKPTAEPEKPLAPAKLSQQNNDETKVQEGEKSPANQKFEKESPKNTNVFTKSIEWATNIISRVVMGTVALAATAYAGAKQLLTGAKPKTNSTHNADTSHNQIKQENQKIKTEKSTLTPHEHQELKNLGKLLKAGNSPKPPVSFIHQREHETSRCIH